MLRVATTSLLASRSAAAALRGHARALTTKPTMSLKDEDNIESIQRFWFDRLEDVIEDDPLVAQAITSRWFAPASGAATEFDRVITQRYGDLVAQAKDNQLTDTWTQTPEGTLSLLLLLDQFARNIDRGKASQFDGDSLAQRIAVAAIQEHSMQTRLSPARVMFLIMPLMHSEDIRHHDIGMPALQYAIDHAPDDGTRDMLIMCRRWFVAHTQLIEQFGRYPHRNSMLGRANTPQEEERLKSYPGF